MARPAPPPYGTPPTTTAQVLTGQHGFISVMNSWEVHSHGAGQQKQGSATSTSPLDRIKYSGVGCSGFRFVPHDSSVVRLFFLLKATLPKPTATRQPPGSRLFTTPHTHSPALSQACQRHRYSPRSHLALSTHIHEEKKLLFFQTSKSLLHLVRLCSAPRSPESWTYSMTFKVGNVQVSSEHS